MSIRQLRLRLWPKIVSSFYYNLRKQTVKHNNILLILHIENAKHTNQLCPFLSAPISIISKTPSKYINIYFDQVSEPFINILSASLPLYPVIELITALELQIQHLPYC